MTSSVLTPWHRFRSLGAASLSGGVEATQILDWQHPAFAAFIDRVRPHEYSSQLHLLRSAHTVISRTIRPVYSVRDDLPVSKIVQRGRGSCSQRLAVLEAVARASGIPTRVRGLLVDGRFWYPRFPQLRFLVPTQVVLAWPEFRLADGWLSVSDLFDTSCDTDRTAAPFTNDSSETLFDALSRTSIDWYGTTDAAVSCSTCDLSAEVLADLAYYPSRDALFTQYGQTLCLPARTLGEPFMSRWSAGATLS